MNKDYNFYEVWKDFYNQSSKLFDEKIKDDFPSQGVSQILEMNLLFKKMMDETTENYLKQVNVPTRNDLANISSLIVNVDSKVDDLEELLEESKAGQLNQANVQKELSNIKKEMKNLDQKMSHIVALLEKQVNTADHEQQQND